MWPSLVPVLLVAVSVGHAANSTDEVTKYPKLECIRIRKMLFFERKACLSIYIKHQTRNDTAIEKDANCTNIDVILNDISRRLTNYSQCFNNDSDTYIKSIRDRLQFLQNATEPTNYTDFMKDDWLKCVKDNVKNIQIKCLSEVLKNDTKLKDVKYSLYRVAPLKFSTRSCSKSSLIKNCAINILNKNCNNSNAKDYVQFLSKKINVRCDKNAGVVSNHGTQKKSSSTSGIIIGILVGIIALLVLGLFATRNFKKCSKPQTESYTISFRQQPQQK